MNFLTKVVSCLALISGSFAATEGMFVGIHTGLNSPTYINYETRSLATHPILRFVHGNSCKEKHAVTKTIPTIGGHLEAGNLFSVQNVYLGGKFAFTKYFSTIRVNIYSRHRLQFIHRPAYSCELSGQVGHKIDSLLFYLKGGAVIQKRKIVLIAADAVPTKYSVVKFNKGMIVGFGMKLPLNKSSNMGVEVTHSRYKAKKIVFANLIYFKYAQKDNNLLLSYSHKI